MICDNNELDEEQVYIFVYILINLKSDLFILFISNKMNSNLLMYLTTMSAVTLHNIVNNIQEATNTINTVDLTTLDTNFTLNDNNNLLNIFKECNGTKQSPININTAISKENLNLRLGLTAYDKPIFGLLINQFPTFQLLPLAYRWPKPSALVSMSIARSFNPYADSYFSLNSVHFYWSSDNTNNSSLHQIDNQTYPLEIHFVHLNTAYTNLDEALIKPDGLLILAVMVIPSTHESYMFDKLIDSLSNITNHNQQVLIDEDSTWRSLLPADTSKFYRYHGSMVMPPCHESVQWIIFDNKLKLGQKQLKRLRRHRFIGKDLRTNSKIDWTLQKRPIQQVNDRIIEHSFGLLRNQRNRYG